MSIDRRLFLIGVGGVVAAGVGAGGAVAWARRRPVGAWAEEVSAAASTRNLGVEYLTRTPGEADRDVLFGHLAGLVPLSAVVGDADRAVAAFNERLRRDFTEGDIIRMGGWLLSRTELRLCALVALEEDERTGSSGVFAPEPQNEGPAVHWTAPVARFTLPPGIAVVEFQVKSGPRDPRTLTARLGGETIDERTIAETDWQRVRYVVRDPGEGAAILELTTTPAWRPQNDFRTLGAALDRVW
jgi:hypothetical protein